MKTIREYLRSRTKQMQKENVEGKELTLDEYEANRIGWLVIPLKGGKMNRKQRRSMLKGVKKRMGL